MKPLSLDPNLDLTYAAPVNIETQAPEWKKSLSALGLETAGFAHGLQALGAQALGMDEARDEALEAYQRNKEEAQSGWRRPEVGRIEDVEGISDLGKWTAYQLPKGIGNLLLLGLGGGVGGALAKGITSVGIKQLAKRSMAAAATELAAKKAGKTAAESVVLASRVLPTAQRAAGELTQQQVRRNITRGAIGGGGAASFGVEGGNIYGELATDPEVGPEAAFGPAMVGGAASTIFDVVPGVVGAKTLGLNNWIKSGLRKTIKESPELAKKAKGIHKRILAGAAGGVALEGPTEGLQELVQIAAERWAKDDPMFAKLDAEQQSAVLNSIAAGSLVGGMVGGAAGPFTQTTQVPVAPEVQSGLRLQRETGEVEGVVRGAPTDQGVAIPGTRTEEQAGAQEGGGAAVTDYGVQVRQQPDGQWEVVAPDLVVSVNVPTEEEAREIADQEIEERAARDEVVPLTIQPQEASQTPKVINLTGMGEAIASNPYEGLYTALAAGKDTFAGIKDPVLAKSKAAFDAGLINSPEDLKNYVALEFPSVEVPRAVEDTQASQVYEDVPGAEPVTRQEVQVPTEEREQGVRTEGQTPEAVVEEVVEVLRKQDGTPFSSSEAAHREMNRRWNSGELQIEKGKEVGRQARARVVKYDDGWVIEKLESRQPAVVPDRVESHIQQPTISPIDAIADSDRVLGQGWTQRAIDAGLLQLNETSEPGVGSGTYSPSTGVSTVNLDKIPKGQTVLDVVAHELGSHAGMAQMLGPERFSGFVADLLTLANNGSETALKAVKGVVDGAIGLAEVTEVGKRTELQKELASLGEQIRQAETPKQEAELRTQARDLLQQQDQWRFNEEVMAYYVQGASQATPVEAGFWNRLRRAIEEWFARTRFGQGMMSLGWSPEISPGLATSLARAGARSVVQQAEAAQKLMAREEQRLKRLPAGVRQEVLEQRVWHVGLNRWAPEPGFPYGRPRLDKVGTGEGGQLFGWGWYSAENKETRDSYISNFTDRTKVRGLKKPASVYRLDIPESSIPFMLQWDKPLSEQTEEVKAALKPVLESIPPPKTLTDKIAELQDDIELNKNNKSLLPQFFSRRLAEIEELKKQITRAKEVAWYKDGETFYQDLQKLLPNVRGEHPKKKVSEYLRSLGIIGNKYLDFGSRELSDSPTYNYVIWDQDVLDQVAHLNPKTGQLLESRFSIPTRTGQSAVIEMDASPRTIKQVLARETARARREGNQFFEGVRILKDPRDGSLHVWPAEANLLHRDVAVQLGIDPSLYDIASVSAQAKTEDQVDEVLAELPEDLGGLRKKFSVGEQVAPRTDVAPLTFQLRDEALAGQLLYSFPRVRDLGKSESWFTSPVSTSVEARNRPGYFNELLHNLVDAFHYAKAWSPEAYRALDEHRNIMGAAHELVKREYFLPMLRLVRRWNPSADELAPFRRMGMAEPTLDELAGHQLAARHVVLDGKVEGAENVNEYLALKIAPKVLDELKPLLNKSQQSRLNAEIEALLGKSKKLPRGQAQQLLLKYSQQQLAPPAQELVNDWLLVQRRGSGYSTAIDPSAVAADEKAGFLNARELFAAAEQNPLFKELGEKSDQLARYQLETLKGEAGRGILQQRDVDALLGAYQHHVPLRREDFDYDLAMQETLESPRQGMGRLLKRVGSSAHPSAANVIQNHLAAGYGAGTAAARNEMFNKLADLIYADKQSWSDKLVIRDKRRHTADVAFERGGKTLFLSPNDKNLRAVALMRVLSRLDSEQIKGPMKLMRSINNWIRWTAVSANPAFIIANTPRDYLTAAYNLKASEAGDYSKEIASWRAYKDAFKALHQVMVKDDRTLTGDAEHDAAIELVEDYEKHGGKTSFVQTLRPQDSQSWRSFANQVHKAKGKRRAVVEFGEKALRSIEDLNVTIENVMRLSTYKVMREKFQKDHGLNEEQAKSKAAELARNLTTNFTRRGAHIDTINTWWLFYNATVQGNWQVIQNLFFNENKKGAKRLAKAVGGTILFSFMLDQIGRATDDEWDEIPEGEKDRKIITPLQAGGDHFSIPAPWVFNIFWRAGSLLSEVTAGVKKPDDALMDLIGLVTSSMDPVGGGKALSGEGTWLQAAAPTSFDWFAQIQENRNWMGNPLGPEGFATNNRPDAYVAWDSMPEGYKHAAQFVNELTGGNVGESGLVDLRPSTYRVLAEFLMGGLGRFGLDLAQTAGIGGGENVFEREGPADVPASKAFFAGPTDQTAVSLYHDRVAKVLSADRLVKEYGEGPHRDPLKLAEVQQDRAAQLRMIPYTQDVERQIKSLRKSVRSAVARDDSQTEEMLRDRIVQLQRRFNESYARRVGN